MTFAVRLVLLGVSLSFVGLALRSVWLTALHVTLPVRRRWLTLHRLRLRLSVHVRAPFDVSALGTAG